MLIRLLHDIYLRDNYLLEWHKMAVIMYNIMLKLQLRKEPRHEEANRLYVMIEPLKREVLEAYSSVRTGRYHQAVMLLKGIIEVRFAACCLSCTNKHYEECQPLWSAECLMGIDTTIVMLLVR